MAGERVCQWCGNPIRREDCPYTSERGFRRLKYHPGTCADEAKKAHTRECRRRNAPLEREFKLKLRERVRLLEKENAFLRQRLIDAGVSLP